MKRSIVAAGVGCLVAVGAGLGYVEIFKEGLDRLPVKPCSGAVERETAARALPDAREAEERGKLDTTEGARFLFACYVRTSSESTISGEVEKSSSSVSGWREYYAGGRGGEDVAFSAGNVEALSFSDGLTTVYVPCTPVGREAGEAREGEALIVEARTIGETRVHGTELRQVVLDFAYQLAQHAYEVGDCQELRTLPDLPPVKSG